MALKALRPVLTRAPNNRARAAHRKPAPQESPEETATFMPTDAETPEQTASRKSHYSYEDLLACGRGELFGAGNAQLPLPPMLMFDRITASGRRAAPTARAMSPPSSISGRTCGSSRAISRATR